MCMPAMRNSPWGKRLRRAAPVSLLVGVVLLSCQAPTPRVVLRDPAPSDTRPPDGRPAKTLPATPIAKSSETGASGVAAPPQPEAAPPSSADASGLATSQVVAPGPPSSTKPTRQAPGSAEPVAAGAPAVAKPAPPPLQQRGRAALPQQNRFYARDNPSYDLLQKANDALAGFPVDPEGQVDWVAALRRGMIEPRSGISATPKMEVLDQDTLMTNTRDMPYVAFPHKVHTQWLACQNCHEELFVSKRGANKMTMNDIFRGRYCGKCHDRVAFSTYVCDRCHTVPKQGDKK